MEPKKESRIADDLLCGAGEIAEFLYGDPGRRRRIYHLAERGGLPVFRLGAAEAVSARALEIGALACKSVASLLARKRDRPAAKDGAQTTLFDHANLRGPGYYH